MKSRRIIFPVVALILLLAILLTYYFVVVLPKGISRGRLTCPMKISALPRFPSFPTRHSSYSCIAEAADEARKPLKNW